MLKSDSPPASGLIAIEPPDFIAAPPLNSMELTGVEWGIVVLLLTLIALLAFWIWRHRVYRPIYLYWQLMKITPKKATQSDQPIPRQWAYLLYQHNLTLYTLSSVTLNGTHTPLMEPLNPLCFAKEEVSRETYLKALNHTKQHLKKLFKQMLLRHKPNRAKLS